VVSVTQKGLPFPSKSTTHLLSHQAHPTTTRISGPHWCVAPSCGMCKRERERGGICWPLRPHPSSSNISTVTRAACDMRPAMERMYLHDTPAPRPLSHPMYQGFVTALSSPAHAMPVLCYSIFPALRPIKPLLLCW
jgi:hypothetical protein